MNKYFPKDIITYVISPYLLPKDEFDNVIKQLNDYINIRNDSLSRNFSHYNSMKTLSNDIDIKYIFDDISMTIQNCIPFSKYILNFIRKTNK